MNNNNLIEKKQNGFFSKIKNWFSGLFGKKNKELSDNNDLEFEKESNVQEEEVFQEYEANSNKLQYEFSGSTVSKQKIEKIRMNLDNGKIDVEELYQLSDNELDELGKLYDELITDSVNKLREIDVNINNYKRRIEKVQN